MANGQHTPGPCGYPIASDGSAGGEYAGTIDIDSPDARLIAAAPELLSLLIELRDSFFAAAVREDYENRVEAAILKAEGTR